MDSNRKVLNRTALIAQRATPIRLLECDLPGEESSTAANHAMIIPTTLRVPRRPRPRPRRSRPGTIVCGCPARLRRTLSPFLIISARGVTSYRIKGSFLGVLPNRLGSLLVASEMAPCPIFGSESETVSGNHRKPSGHLNSTGRHANRIQAQ